MREICSKWWTLSKLWDNLSDAHIVIKTTPNLDQRTFNLPTVDQVAAIWKDGEASDAGAERDIRVYTDVGHSRKINYYFGCYDPLQYPLLFPNGEPGWHAGIEKVPSRRAPFLEATAWHCIGEGIAVPGVVGSVDEMLAIEASDNFSVVVT